MRNAVLAGLIIAAAFVAGGARAADAPKAYVIGEVNVTDPEGYKTYIAAATPLVAKFGGIYIARGGRTVPLEGAPPAGRIVLIQFPSLAAAQAFETSPEYLKVAPIRQHASTERFFIVEGRAP